MYAVIKTGGKQYRVAQGDTIRVEKLEGEVGSEISFDEILMIGGDKPIVGTPVVKGAKVSAKIIGQDKAKKVIVFKMMRRQNYKRKYGHRQPYTELKITELSADGVKLASAKPKKAAAPKKAEASKAVAASKADLPKGIKQDDLTVVEGIGPKIAGLLKDAGIDTWAKLAKTKVEAIAAILKEAGPRYSTHVPTTWPKQSEMADQGKWDELKKWQDELDGGK